MSETLALRKKGTKRQKHIREQGKSRDKPARQWKPLAQRKGDQGHRKKLRNQDQLRHHEVKRLRPAVRPEGDRHPVNDQETDLGPGKPSCPAHQSRIAPQVQQVQKQVPGGDVHHRLVHHSAQRLLPKGPMQHHVEPPRLQNTAQGKQPQPKQQRAATSSSQPAKQARQTHHRIDQADPDRELVVTQGRVRPRQVQQPDRLGASQHRCRGETSAQAVVIGRQRGTPHPDRQHACPPLPQLKDPRSWVSGPRRMGWQTTGAAHALAIPVHLVGICRVRHHQGQVRVSPVHRWHLEVEAIPGKSLVREVPLPSPGLFSGDAFPVGIGHVG